MSEQPAHSEWWIRPLRNRGEDGASYCLRLADANGFPTARNFCSELGITLGAVASGRFLPKVAEVGRCDPFELAHDSPSRRSDGIWIAGQYLGNGLYRRTSGRRFCPECLRDDIARPSVELTMPREWNRVWWDIVDVTSCPIHRARLQSRCMCGAAFDHQRAGIGQCRCGFSVRNLPVVRARTANAASYILGRLGFGPSRSAPVLDDLTLADALRGIRIFGTSASSPEADDHVIMETGFAILSGGEQSVGAILDRVAATRPERAGALGAYGELHAFARDTANGRGSPHLIGAMRVHAARRRERRGATSLRKD